MRSGAPMSVFKHIFVGVDFSKPASRAFHNAQFLTRNAGEITAIHACADFMPDPTLLPPEQWNAVRMEAYNEGMEQLKQFLSMTEARNTQGYVLFGDASDQLIRVAQEKGGDLLMIGATGRGAVLRALLGSTAEDLTRKSPFPVWISRDAPHTLQTIVAAVDGSEESLGIVQTALALAKDNDAKLMIVHAYPDLNSSPVFSMAEMHAQNHVQESHLERAQKVLNDLRIATQWDASGVDVEPFVVPGRASKALTTLAEDKGADLIVLSSHGHSALYRFALGTTTSRVIRTSPCDVLVLPGKAEDN